MEAVSRLGYRPNAAARALRRNRSMSLGVVFPNLDTPQQFSILKGLGAASQEGGYSLLVTNSQGDSDLYETLIQRLFEARVDGLFLAAPIGLKAAVEPYRRAGVPVLALFTKDDSASEIPLVTANEDAAIRQAVWRALSLGHRVIGQIATRVEFEFSTRVSEVDRAIEDCAGARHVIEVVSPRQQGQDVGAIFVRMLASHDRPTVLICRDLYLEAVLPALEELRLKVPDDLSLISFNDSRWTRWLSPPISTISVDSDDIGHTAARVMLDWLNGTAPEPVTYSKPAEWIERASLGPAPR
jgi:DNA-binding LacI/PurR family transcriptional regulator